MIIRFPRGDIHTVTFSITDSTGTVLGTDFDEIFFTVKASFSSKSVLIQKKLSNGGIVKDGEAYTFTLQPEDTNALDFKKYVFDIEIILGTEIKSTVVGEFVLTPEVTHQRDE